MQKLRSLLEEDIQPKAMNKCGKSLTDTEYKYRLNPKLGFYQRAWYVLAVAKDADYKQDKVPFSRQVLYCPDRFIKMILIHS